MNVKKTISLLAVISVFSHLYGQPGGKAYQFLEMTNSARIAALGGKEVAIYDNDLNMPYYNPSLLSPGMDQNLVLNYVNYFAGINYGYASYARDIKNIGTFAGGIHYLNYGSFIRADETGMIDGKFHASDYAFNLIYSRKIDSLISAGINFKPVFSYLDTYSSFAVAFDVGITYHNPEKLFTASIVLRNAGLQLSTYYSGAEHEPLPLDLAIGISQSLRHAPFKFYFVADHLEKFDLTYKTEQDIKDEIDPFTGEPRSENNFDVTLDKIMRHIIIGTEFNLTQNFVLRFGYNYRRRQEMKIDSKAGTVGFSWGVGIKISRFHISYGRSAYHLAGSPNYFSISMNLKEFNKKF